MRRAGGGIHGERSGLRRFLREPRRQTGIRGQDGHALQAIRRRHVRRCHHAGELPEVFLAVEQDGAEPILEGELLVTGRMLWATRKIDLRPEIFRCDGEGQFVGQRCDFSLRK